MAGAATIATTADAADDLVLGRYRLGRRLGAGAHGTVYEARDERLARDVAVKVVGLEGHGPGRSQREVLAAARLAHPAIVTLYEAGAEAGNLYLVSELVRGRTLGALLAGGLLSDRDVARIGVALCDALAHAHAHGVVHRDVKPQNVIVPDDPEGGAGIVKLTDFGVARLAGAEALTGTGDVVGTLAYMAPEQAAGGAAGPPADLYALALVLYEGLTGANPLRAATPAATARRLGSVLPPIGAARPDLPSSLTAALDAALAPEPDARGTTADLRSALGAAARDLADEPGHVARPAASPVPGRVSRAAGRVIAGLSAAALLLLVVAATAPVPPPGGAVVWAGIAAALVVALPRVGWLVAAAATVTWLATRAGRPGSALVLLAGVLPVPLLLPRAGRLWSLPVLAPALGLVGLAGGEPGLAGCAAAQATRRAALGALGFLWLALAEVLTGERLYLGPPRGVAPAAAWAGDAGAALSDALIPLARSGLLAVAAVWAAAAVILPWLVRGRHLAADVVLAATWAGATAAGAGAVAHGLGGVPAGGDARGAVAGALAGAAVAVAVRRLAGPAPPEPGREPPTAGRDALP